MHATIQKSLDEIKSFFKKGEKIFVVGCSNCAAKCHSGGEEETNFMAERLIAKGIEVSGWAVPPNGGSLCKLSIAEKMLNEDHREAAENADSLTMSSPTPATEANRAPVFTESPSAVKSVTLSSEPTVPTKAIPVCTPAPTGIQGSPGSV